MRKTLGILLALAAATLPAEAQVKAGGEFIVNSYTTGYQFGPAVSAAADGSFAVAWVSLLQDGSDEGVFGQRFDARGRRTGGEFQVNTYTTASQGFYPSLGLGMDGIGRFVVTWASLYQDGSLLGVFGQRFDRAGGRDGREFQVNTYTPEHQQTYGSAMGPNGQFVVTWTGPHGGSAYQVFARRYDAHGDALGAELQVNSTTPEALFKPDVAMGSAGQFVVVWEAVLPSRAVVMARRFDAAGTAVGAEFEVGGSSTASAYYPTVAIAPNSSFVVAWEQATGQDVSIRARRFSPAGTPLGDELAVSDRGVRSFVPDVAFDDAGRFVVAWQGDLFVEETSNAMARRFEADGTSRGGPFQVNTFSTAGQAEVSVASDPVGNFVVTWETDYEDGSGTAVIGQRFGGLQPAALAVNDGGNGVLEVGDTFTLATAWRNVNGAAQAFEGRSSHVVAPRGTTLTLSASARYGTVADGAVGTCVTCFGGSLRGTRPAGHQDASFDEDLLPDTQGQKKTWVLHVGGSFADVPAKSPFYRSVETLVHAGITSGCGSGAYCPGAAATRGEMAALVLAAKDGAGYAPPACTTGAFGDVPATSAFCPFVEELARRGVIGGCDGGSYCPNDAVTREQMAVFVLRTLDPALDPPACTTPVFADVPASSPFCRWVEEMVRRGITAGCGGGNFCPGQPVTRGQMAVFLTTAFGLTL